MNSGPTAERIHETLRARIISREFRPGDRLDPAALAGPLAASVTPVRDALHLLAGEGLVEARSGGGFHVPALDEPALVDLYDWSADVLALALRAWPRAATPVLLPDHSGQMLVDRVEATFLAIAHASPNGEHAATVVRLNRRLHAARIVEGGIILDPDAEIAQMADAVVAGDRAALRRLILYYHRRRSRAAAQIVRAVYRAD